MTLLTYESLHVGNPPSATLPILVLAAGLANVPIAVAGVYVVSQLNNHGDGAACMFLLLCESTTIAFFALWAVARIMKSRGRLRALFAAAIGSFFASFSGLLITLAGLAYAARFLQNTY